MSWAGIPKAADSTSNIKDVDLIVIGASFAGLMCARAAAMRGLRTVVIERKPDPGANLRTTGIIVKEAADEIDFPCHLGRRIPGVRLYDSKHQFTDLSSPGYYFVATDTAELLRYLAAQTIRAGAQIRCGERFEGVELVPGGGYLLRGLGLRCRFLVGADGARSKVARALGLGQNKKFLYGIEAELPLGSNLDPAFLHCFVSARFAPGYIGWALAGPKVLQVGLASARQETLKLEEFTRAITPLFGLQTNEPISRRAGSIPCGGLVERFAGPRSLLIGDAAGWVSPLTGGGIEPSLRLGRKAGLAIADYLHGEGNDPAEVIRPLLPNYRMKKTLRARGRPCDQHTGT